MLEEENPMNTATARTKVSFRNILFATDFSEAAAHAIPYAKKIAELFDANLVALYVRPPVVNPMTPPATWANDIEVVKAVDEREREELLRTFAGIRTQVLIEEGDIQACLAAVMEKNNTDLVVIGTRGRNGLGKLLLGSTAEEIFRTVTCPVLTVGPHSSWSHEPNLPVREILYATDLSPEAKAVADYAISLAEEFQATLILLHVVKGLEPVDLVAPVNIEADLETLLHELVPSDDAVRCKAEYYLEGGDPAKKILECARFRKPDLIVLGARAEKGPLTTTHAPSAVAHKVVSYAECPVLTVRH
jgi:nucleotide-binding universal stress UspA family protein